MTDMSARVLLCAMRSKAHSDRERLQELSRFVERAFGAERKRRKAKATREMKKVADEKEAGFLAAGHYEDIFQVETDFPRIQRYALVASMMGMVEANVVGFCRVARRIFAIPAEFNDRGSCVITRGVQYLVEEAGVDTSRFRSYVTLAEKLSKVRNCMVHAEGSLGDRKEAGEIREFAEAHPRLVIDDRDRLVPKNGFMESNTHEMHIFLDRLHDALKKRLDAQQTSADDSSPRAARVSEPPEK